MSDNPLAAFLKPRDFTVETAEIPVSDHYTDSEGNVINFKIKSISDFDCNRLKDATSKKRDASGNLVMDWDEYYGRLVVACTIFPPFANAELCEAYGNAMPYQMPGKLLAPGEFAYLRERIENLCGFKNRTQQIEDDAKN